MTTRFRPVSTPSGTPYGVGRVIQAEDLPDFYAWAAARLIPEFDRQMIIGSAAEALSFLVDIWPVDTGRSVNSWEAGINSSPPANNAPGPRPVLSRRQVEERLAGVRSGDVVIVANRARKPGEPTSYAHLLWMGASRKMPRGAQRPLEKHLQRAQDGIVRRAEDRALGGPM